MSLHGCAHECAQVEGKELVGWLYGLLTAEQQREILKIMEKMVEGGQ